MRQTTLESIDEEIRVIRKRLRRLIETGDLKRMAKLKERLDQLQAKLDTLKRERNRFRRSFRRSYSYEFYLDRLHKFFSKAVKIDRNNSEG